MADYADDIAARIQEAKALIEDAAAQKFEGAITFLSNAYALGLHGYPKDEKLAAHWHRKLGDKDVIGI